MGFALLAMTDNIMTELTKHEPTTIYIKPSTGLAALNLRDLWTYRELVYFMIWRDIKVKYKQTLLGMAWAVIQPVMNMLVFTFVFDRVAKLATDGVQYEIFSFTALLPWGLFVTALNMLPFFQLDGGHVSYALFGRHHRRAVWPLLGGLAALGEPARLRLRRAAVVDLPVGPLERGAQGTEVADRPSSRCHSRIRQRPGELHHAERESRGGGPPVAAAGGRAGELRRAGVPRDRDQRPRPQGPLRGGGREGARRGIRLPREEPPHPGVGAAGARRRCRSRRGGGRGHSARARARCQTSWNEVYRGTGAARATSGSR